MEIGADLMSTSVDYKGFKSGVDSLSLMAVGRYVFPIAQGAEGYVGAGLGAIRVKYDGSTDFPTKTGHGTVAGGMIEAGPRADIGQGAKIFGAVRHQVAFNQVAIKDGDAFPDVKQSFDNTSLLVGISFSF